MTIAPSAHVADIVTEAPATIAVFQRHQIEFCCGGHVRFSFESVNVESGMVHAARAGVAWLELGVRAGGGDDRPALVAAREDPRSRGCPLRRGGGVRVGSDAAGVSDFYRGAQPTVRGWGTA